MVTDGWASKNGPVFRATTPNARVKAMDASVAVNTEKTTSFETELFVRESRVSIQGCARPHDAHAGVVLSRKRVYVSGARAG